MKLNVTKDICLLSEFSQLQIFLVEITHFVNLEVKKCILSTFELKIISSDNLWMSWYNSPSCIKILQLVNCTVHVKSFFLS